MVALTMAASNHSVTSAIDDGTYSTIPLHHYKQAVMASEDCYKGIETLIWSYTRIITAPESCPDEYNPEVITRKRMQAEVTRELSATLTPVRRPLPQC